MSVQGLDVSKYSKTIPFWPMMQPDRKHGLSFAQYVIRDIAENEPCDPNDADALCVSAKGLEAIIEQRLVDLARIPQLQTTAQRSDR